MEERCFPTRRLVAQGPVCTIESCSCGVLHVTLGVLTLRLQAEVIASIRDTLDEALENLLEKRGDRAMSRRPSQERPS